MCKTGIERMALNAKLGDGGIYKNKNAYCMMFVSTSLDYLTYKRDQLIKVRPAPIILGKSGYNGKKQIYKFSVRTIPEAVSAYAMSNIEAIKSMDKLDLILWMLDDGSVHKQHGTFHLYSNMLNREESEVLTKQIYKLYPVRMPSINTDRKKDGRSFLYIYMPRILAEVIQLDMEAFMNENMITSLLYKSARKYTLNDHRKATGRPPEEGPATFRT